MFMKIVIIGAGFAGIKCARRLASLKGHDIILFNKKDYTVMIPSLPDIAGGRVKEKYITERITRLVPGNIRFLNEAVISVDIDSKIIATEKNIYKYDILVLACGVEVNFFGFDQNLEKVFTLENLEDALHINKEIIKMARAGSLKNVVISGAGFTGLEVGANMHTLLKDYPGISIHFIEKTGMVLNPQEPYLANFVKRELERTGLKFHMEDTIKEFDGYKVVLESGAILDSAALIWTSGMKRALQINGNYRELPNGRLIVNPDLRLAGCRDVFAAGDCSALQEKGNYLRMSVNYAGKMGALAGENIKRLIEGKPLLSYRPFDPGWLLPANHTCVGYVFNIRIRGRIGIILHFLITGMKNYNLGNFLAFTGYAFKFFFTARLYR
jgi:NADH dehydrogenase